ncbi:MAG TPA: hypothetical protein VGF12_18825 [Roseateles sp.]|uniref:hypothetical protein n=1 Tax=Roseateles sp. TaxID=1971397 RepID=UPI002EDA9289
MVVDLVELNHAGRRLPREVWRAAVPIRGELSVLKYMSWHGHKGGPVFAALRAQGLVADLSKARIWHMSGRSTLLSGQQRTQGRTDDQVCWCRFVQ